MGGRDKRKEGETFCSKNAIQRIGRAITSLSSLEHFTLFGEKNTTPPVHYYYTLFVCIYYNTRAHSERRRRFFLKRLCISLVIIMSAAASDGGDDATKHNGRTRSYYYSREEEEDDDDDDTNNNNTNNNAKTTTKTTKTLESKYSTTNRVPALMYTLGYLIFSTITVVSNKHLIKDAGFGNPIFVSSCGTAFACVASAILVHGKMVEITEPRMTMKEWMKVCVPVGLFSSITLACANVVYVYLSLSFVQMLKAFVPVVTYATHVCVGTDKYNSDFTVSLLAMVVGGVMCMNVSGKATAIGVSVMFGSHFAEAIRTVGAQWLLVNRKFGVIESMYYFAPATVVFFIPLVYYFEGESLQAPGVSDVAKKYWYLFVVSSSWGCLVNACGLGVVKNIGAVWFKGINNIKNILLLFFGIVVYGDVVTVLQAFGYTLSLVGFGRYTYVKNAQMVANTPPSIADEENPSQEEKEPLLKK